MGSLGVFRDRRGFSLVSTLILSSIAIGTVTALSSSVQMGIKGAKGIEYSSELNQLHSTLSKVFLDSATCGSSFQTSSGSAAKFSVGGSLGLNRIARKVGLQTIIVAQIGRPISPGHVTKEIRHEYQLDEVGALVAPLPDTPNAGQTTHFTQVEIHVERANSLGAKYAQTTPIPVEVITNSTTHEIIDCVSSDSDPADPDPEWITFPSISLVNIFGPTGTISGMQSTSTLTPEGVCQAQGFKTALGPCKKIGSGFPEDYGSLNYAQWGAGSWRISCDQWAVSEVLCK